MSKNDIKPYRNIFVAAMLWVLVLSICADGATPKIGGTLIFGRGGDSIGLDPAHEVDGESFKVCGAIYDTLIQYKDESTEVEPALAESWEASADGRHPNALTNSAELFNSARRPLTSTPVSTAGKHAP